MEKRAALRRRRTRNKKYASDEFTSIFSQRKNAVGSHSYTTGLEGLQEEIVTFDGMEVVEMTVDQVSQAHLTKCLLPLPNWLNFHRQP